MVSGTIVEGGAVTIQTYGAGTGPTIANILYEDFADEVVDEGMDLTATVGSWTSGGTGLLMSADAHSGGLSGIACDPLGFHSVEKNFTLATEIFVSFAEKVPDGSHYSGATAEETFPAGSTTKPIWLFGDDHNSVGDCDAYLGAWGGGNFVTAGNDLTPGLNVTKSSALGWQWDAWVRHGYWLKGGATPNVDAGNFWWQTVREGVSQNTHTSTPVIFANGTAPYGWAWLKWYGYSQSESANDLNLIDTLYMCSGAGACSRVEIGDNEVYTSCTKLSICNATAWADDQVTFTVRKGSHASLVGKFLFVFNASNVCNLIGYPL